MTDVYQALIISSSLLLELKSDKQHDSRQVLQKDEPITILQTMRHSMLLLQRLGNIFLLLRITSGIYNGGDSVKSDKTHMKRVKLHKKVDITDSNFDWHNNLLPTSKYSLLQECFVRKKLSSLKDNVVLGRDERRVSLDIRH